MGAYAFTSNDWPTLGVEVELQLIDRDTCALKSAILDILPLVPDKWKDSVKPEISQCYVEVNSRVGRYVDEIDRDLREKILAVEKIAGDVGARLFWSASHPFSHWVDQQITPNERYYALVALLQDTARRVMTFGLHVHVGVDTGDKAVMICDRILRHLPTLLALSVNSPFWVGRQTGLMSQRSKIMDALPTAGLPPLMRNWSEYVWLVNHLVDTGFIHSVREIWWDIRPHHKFGTVEVRICDLPPTLKDVSGLAALIQCLVHALSEEIDGGTYQHDCHPMIVRQNKWRAARFGLETMLVNPITQESLPARRVAEQLLDQLFPTAEKLKCAHHLNHVRRIIESPSGAEHQVAIYKETHSLTEVIRRMMASQGVDASP